MLYGDMTKFHTTQEYNPSAQVSLTIRQGEFSRNWSRFGLFPSRRTISLNQSTKYVVLILRYAIIFGPIASLRATFDMDNEK